MCPGTAQIRSGYISYMWVHIVYQEQKNALCSQRVFLRSFLGFLNIILTFLEGIQKNLLLCLGDSTIFIFIYLFFLVKKKHCINLAKPKLSLQTLKNRTKLKPTPKVMSPISIQIYALFKYCIYPIFVCFSLFPAQEYCFA